MRHAVVFVLLCIIATADIACSRRSPRAVRLPSTAEVARDNRAPRVRGTGDVKGAIDALKKRLQQPSTPDSQTEHPGAIAQSGDASTPGTGVGTSGTLSVETRYPAPPVGASHPTARGRVLSRASDAVRRVGGDASAWVIVLCALAAGLIVVVLMRRSHHSA
jgi:hypothetical protein